MNRTLDLRARGEKTILVKVEGSELDRDKELDYLEVVDMDPLIQTFRKVYAEDLMERIKATCGIGCCNTTKSNVWS